MYVLVAIAIVGVGVNLEPLSGDLTRTGGFSENDFGWNDVLYGFDQRLFFQGRPEDYDRYYDVVVFGDSFSLAVWTPKEKQPGPSDQLVTSWNNFFVNDTGLSMAVFRVEEIDEVLNSPHFREFPPRLVVYETIERELVNQTQMYEGGCLTSDSPVGPLFEKKPLGLQLVESRRPRRHLKGVLDFDSSVTFISEWLKRKSGFGSANALALDLETGSLFSSVRSDKLLVWYGDMAKSEFTHDDIEHAWCSLLDLQARCQESGATLFVAMVLPDKLSAYQRHLSDAQAIHEYVLYRVPPPDALNHPPIADEIFDAIDRGEPDIYLSNDTHLTWKGTRIVSDALIAYLVDENFLVQEKVMREK